VGRIRNFLKNTHAPGSPSRTVPGVGDANRIATVLMDIQGVNCRIEKPGHRGGLGWKIIVDGTSDISPPPEVQVPWQPVKAMQFGCVIGPLNGSTPTVRVYAGYHMTPYGAYGWLPTDDYEDIDVTGSGWIITRQAKSGPGTVDVLLQGTQANPATTTYYESDVCKVTYDAGDISIKYTNPGERNFVATV